MTFIALATSAAAAPKAGASRGRSSKLDPVLEKRADSPGKSRVILRLKPGFDATNDVKNLGGKLGRRLSLINGQVIEISNGQLRQLEKLGAIESIHDDRPVEFFNYRTSVTVGARSVRHQYGYEGAGVGIAVIDSGITSWHDDVTGGFGPYGNQRVAAFVDFVNARTTPYDDNGHGTHIAGTILGNGYDSLDKKAGIAPQAHLVSLKVLDANGQGTISNIIAALDWVHENYSSYSIRVINLSIGAGVYQSYWTDPLTLATKRLVDRGIVVVAAAGNLGRNSQGQPQYGAITAPANAPWVLTVGASSTMGTLTRVDDTIAGFSSRGPTYVDQLAKPDLVAPGAGTVSLTTPETQFYATKAQYLVSGSTSLGLPFKPYLSLSGTSMAAPVVSGTVALMLEANPNLSPNLVKAILQYTAQDKTGYDALTQGAGFLNTLGAVRLSRFFVTAQAGDVYPRTNAWSRQIIWGNHRLRGGYLTPNVNAWRPSIIWGDALTPTGANIVWGNNCPDTDPACDNIVWGNADGNDIEWGNDGGDNIVWGNQCDPLDPLCDNIVWGQVGDDENIVWGRDCGGADCDNIVWGQECTDPLTCGDNIVWGNTEPGDNIIWGAITDPNAVWGTSLDADFSWGSDASGNEQVVFDDSDPDSIDTTTEPLFEDLFAPVTTTLEPVTTTTTEPVTTTTEPVTTTTAVLGGAL